MAKWIINKKKSRIKIFLWFLIQLGESKICESKESIRFEPWIKVPSRQFLINVHKRCLYGDNSGLTSTIQKLTWQFKQWKTNGSSGCILDYIWEKLWNSWIEPNYCPTFARELLENWTKNGPSIRENRLTFNLVKFLCKFFCDYSSVFEDAKSRLLFYL